VAQLGPLIGQHAGEVEHAGQLRVGADDRRTGAAVDRGAVEEVFAAVQPHRVQLAERAADGRGADAVLGQVNAQARDGVHRGHGGIGGGTDRDDHTLGVGQQAEVARWRDRAVEVGQHLPRGVEQHAVGFAAAAQRRP
jgi:hypothetical protein